MPDLTHPRPCVCPYSRVRASAGQGLGIRSERPWALVRLNATTSPYHSFYRGRDAPSRRAHQTPAHRPLILPAHLANSCDKVRNERPRVRSAESVIL